MRLVRCCAQLALAASALALACPSSASAGSLPSAGSGHRPGPDILYAPAPNAPQLRNAGPWRAAPILVSGASAYRRGEFLYQDFLYDDHGALGIPDPTDPFMPAEFLFSPKKGTLTYPTAHSYANNAADLVELRIKPLARSTALRVTLNSLADPERTAFTVAIGSSAAKVRWPHGAGVESRARLFLTVHGDHAELVTARGEEVGPPPAVALSRARRQFDVRIPHAAWNPRRSKVRFAAGVGLWDRVRRRYVAPGAVATADGTGGGSTSGAALFNVAFRNDEPMPHIAQPPIGNTIVEGGLGVRDDGAWWRERAQALALAKGDISPFYARVDFGKLARRVNDDSQVPKTGFFDRVYASRFVHGQGIDHSRNCLLSLTGAGCIPRFLGQLQNYAIYVPPRRVPAQGFGFTFLLHGLSANHNEFIASRHARDFGERGSGSIVASPNGRGPDGGWIDLAEADAFEVWADVARHYKLDSRFNAVGGYSMGGIGTFRLTSRWPDLFAAGVPVVGATQGIGADMPSLRNVPIMMWNVGTDELVNPALTLLSRNDLETAGVRFDSWLFPVGGHITLGNNDFYGPMTAFLGSNRVDPNPPHVTFVRDRSHDSVRALAVSDHAYWVSEVVNRVANDPGTIDVRSEGFGVGDAPVLPLRTGSGSLEGGSHGPLLYTFERRDWGAVPSTPIADRLVVKATNIASATIDPRRARITCGATLAVTTDGPFKLTLAGCGAAGVKSFGG
jgi:predicted esterase